ncbi:hypothetical protein JOD43_001112 [Pullulanibacillus pueri]|uniref:DUF2642 domain-containing protein n=1 Tax=Pullulanibacillus pueri TaxID=1437324 RepID=A0A8J2ZVW6_9BACL|nr:hypothetical protein [Pullulanibacillus pueri]MBM7680946.1 hypothetical protein [Pullulanibacillus pueri]GGH81438.1 hypothetical protein GCM10007096_19340 [Pullulanibacillus pueri]
MFSTTFIEELQSRIGERAEVATDNNLVQGILVNVTNSLALVVETSGYGTNDRVFIGVDAINFVRFLA